MSHKPIIALILARQNSKGIPLKNLALVDGISLLGRAILSAQESGIFDRIIVSTDGEKIIQEAKKYQAEVVVRPEFLAEDTTKSIDSALHSLQSLNITAGTICLLQPTSPLRNARHIQEAFALFQNHGCVISACLAEHHPYKCIIAKENNLFHAVKETYMLESPRQSLPQAYRPNGAIYFNQIEDLIKYQSFIINPIQLYIMDQVHSIDIDNPTDLEEANYLIKEYNHEA